jgi:hypothetical protein
LTSGNFDNKLLQIVIGEQPVKNLGEASLTSKAIRQIHQCFRVKLSTFTIFGDKISNFLD